MRLLNGGTVAQRLRLISGLILFAFALTHFLNHAVGLIGIEAMSTVQGWRTAVTHSLLGSLVLGLALVAHVVLALAKLARRATLRMPAWEAVQIVLGLAIPYLLIPHMAATRLAQELFGVLPTYEYELVQLWPGKAVDQTVLLLLVWVHGCIGLHFWLRLRRWYDRAFPLLFALATLVPLASLAGFMVAGRATADLYSDPALLAALREQTNWPDRAEVRTILLSIDRTRLGFALLLGFILLILAGQWIRWALRSRLVITYVPNVEARISYGPTLLEISRMSGIPHAAVCGGRARCSTCRVRVDKGADTLPRPEAAEAETLARIGAGPDVRLACQIRPTAPLTVVRLVNPTASGGLHRTLGRDEAQGVERICAVLFLDIRGFTQLSQDKLPYDVVFILNRLFAASGVAITRNDGWIDKYLGDGLMAVFGRTCGPEEACRQALRAAKAIDEALDDVNRDLENELPTPLHVGIGIHVGPLVLGEIGYEDSAAMTVIGRTVNAAARLEAATKQAGCQLIVSLDAARLAGLDGNALRSETVTVRGLSDPLEVVFVERARRLQLMGEKRSIHNLISDTPGLTIPPKSN